MADIDELFDCFDDENVIKDDESRPVVVTNETEEETG